MLHLAVLHARKLCVYSVSGKRISFSCGVCHRLLWRTEWRCFGSEYRVFVRSFSSQLAFPTTHECSWGVSHPCWPSLPLMIVSCSFSWSTSPGILIFIEGFLQSPCCQELCPEQPVTSCSGLGSCGLWNWSRARQWPHWLLSQNVWNVLFLVNLRRFLVLVPVSWLLVVFIPPDLRTLDLRLIGFYSLMWSCGYKFNTYSVVL